MAKLADRLISVHIHDNQGTGDDHNIPFSGTVDWDRLTGILASSGYTKWISEEVSMRKAGIAEEPIFLARAFETAQNRIIARLNGLPAGTTASSGMVTSRT